MKKIITILSFLILVACTSEKSFVKEYVVDQNQPIRTLRVIVFYNEYVNVNKLLWMVEEASRLTELEVGINFKVTKCIPVGGNSYSMYDYFDVNPNLALCQLVSLCQVHYYKPKDYDIALGFANDPFLQKHLSWALTKPFGVIEDDYRKHIVFQHPTVRVVRHEIYHAFILSKGHTDQLMGSVSVINPNPNASWLNQRDRREVLANKWRDFSKRVEISSAYRQDRISPLERKR